jgi:prepilin-type N-terminal cleavage/methylation domain-containing protein
MIANQKGSTLIELLVVVAIAGMLAFSLISFIVQTTKGAGIITDQITSTQQVQNAARSISRDVKLAANTNLGNGTPSVDNLTMQWTDEYQGTNQEHIIQYYVSGGELKRSYDGLVMTVARYISNMEFSRNSSVITVDITSTPDSVSGQSERGIYHVVLRQE